MKECENCGGQGIDPNDDGTGTLLCEVCGGSCLIKEDESPKTISELRKKVSIKTAPNHGLLELYRRGY